VSPQIQPLSQQDLQSVSRIAVDAHSLIDGEVIVHIINPNQHKQIR
jgi:hypothetical protein